MSSYRCVSPDEQICKDAARQSTSTTLSPSDIALICLSGGLPNSFVHIPLDMEAGSLNNKFELFRVTARQSHQFKKYGSTNA